MRTRGTILRSHTILPIMAKCRRSQRYKRSTILDRSSSSIRRFRRHNVNWRMDRLDNGNYAAPKANRRNHD